MTTDVSPTGDLCLFLLGCCCVFFCFFILFCFWFGFLFLRQLAAIEHVERPSESHEGVGRKKKCQVICSACLVQLALTKTGLPALALEAKNIQACKEEPSETSLSLVGSGAVIDLDICSENSSEAADTTSSSSDE